MFWVWFGLAALSLLRPTRRAWAETLGLAAIAFSAVPVVNAATTDRGLIPSLRIGDWLFVGFDVAMLAIAALCGFAALKAFRPQPRRPALARAPAPAIPEAAPVRENADAL